MNRIRIRVRYDKTSCAFKQFYFYNINTLKVCGGDVSCNGVQIRLTMKAIYMFNKVKEYRYEVKMNQY